MNIWFSQLLAKQQLTQIQGEVKVIRDRRQGSVLLDRRTLYFLLAENSNLQLSKGSGCSTCGDTGFKGMTALHELLPIDKEIRELILRGDFSTPQIQELGKAKGMRTLREDGMEKVARGVTTLEEVLMKTMDSN